MLVFIDESGDTGLKVGQGSSQFFVVSMTIFNDNNEATVVDKRISRLRKELRLPETYEFHFAHNSDRVRKNFLSAVSTHSFKFIGLAISKDARNVDGRDFGRKQDFYESACSLIFSKAKSHLSDATVVLDKSGSADFRNKLATYLRRNFNTRKIKVIKKLKQQSSRSNNLLQLADYITGIVNRKAGDRKDWKEYYRFIAKKEVD